MNKILDVIFEMFTSWVGVVLSLVFLSIVSFLGGEFWWGVFWAGLAVWLGICELLSYIFTKKSLTNRYRMLLKDPAKVGFAKAFMAGWWLLFGILAGHLLL